MNLRDLVLRRVAWLRRDIAPGAPDDLDQVVAERAEPEPAKEPEPLPTVERPRRLLEQHGCGCGCRALSSSELWRRRDAENAFVEPRVDLWVLPFLRHRCGPHCRDVDRGGPVVQGRRDPKTLQPLEPVTPGAGP